MRRTLLAKTGFVSLCLLASAAVAGGCGSAVTLDFGESSGGSGGRGGEGGSGATTAAGGSGAQGAQGGAGGEGAQGGGGSSPSCGDGVQEGSEECDGADLGGHDCTDLGFASPEGATCVGCVVDYSQCAAECGNGVAEEDELCDGADLGMVDCTDLGFVNPAGLVCDAACDDFDASGCAAACNGTLEPGEECDGADLNGIDCVDFGFANPAGLKCTGCILDSSDCTATCGNGTQEPGEECDDGNLTNGDGCSSTCTIVTPGSTCESAIAVSLGFGSQTFTGTTVGGGVFAAACASAGPSRVYAVTVTEPGFLTASLTRSGTKYPSVLHARTTCGDAASTILCADSVDPGGAKVLTGGEVISFPVNDNQTVYVIVDGAGAADAGDYELVIDLSAGTTCDDPIPIRLEKGSPMTLRGLTNGKSQSTGGTCGGGGLLFGASDVVYNVNFVDTTTNVTASLSAAGTSYNSILYARSSCDFGQYACSNANGNGGESITFDPNDDDTTYIWIDGNNGAEGNYTLVLTPPLP